MSSSPRYLPWSTRRARPHEQLIHNGVKYLLLEGAVPQHQLAIHNVERRIDMVVQGYALRDAVPPDVFQSLRTRPVLVEFESRPLALRRLRHMVSAHCNADDQLAKERCSDAPTDDAALLVYTPSITERVRRLLAPTEEAGIFHTSYMELHAYVVDASALTSHSPYCYLKLLHAPMARSAQDYEAQIVARIHHSLQYAILPPAKLQEFIMTTLKDLMPDPNAREDIYRQTLPEARAQGIAQGRAEGRAEGETRGATSILNALTSIPEEDRRAILGQFVSNDALEKLAAYLRDKAR